MREEGFIDLQQSLFVIHEEIKDVRFVSACEVRNFNSILCELSQSEQTFFKLFCLLRALVKLLELLSVVNLVLESSLHDVFPDLLDAFYEEGLQLIPFRALVDPVCDDLPLVLLLPVNDVLEVTDGICVAGLESLDVLDDLVFDVDRSHP